NAECSDSRPGRLRVLPASESPAGTSDARSAIARPAALSSLPPRTLSPMRLRVGFEAFFPRVGKRLIEPLPFPRAGPAHAIDGAGRELEQRGVGSTAVVEHGEQLDQLFWQLNRDLPGRPPSPCSLASSCASA